MANYLRQFFNLGWEDLYFIEKYYALIKDNITFAPLGEIPLAQVTANLILEQIFLQINYEVFSRIKNYAELHHNGKKKKLINLCNQRIDEFCPYLNCIDSYFNNEIDQVSIEGKSIPAIANEVCYLLLNQEESL